MRAPRTAARKAPPPVTVRGTVPEDVASAARDQVVALIAQLPGDVSAATVRLTPAAQTGHRAQTSHRAAQTGHRAQTNPRAQAGHPARAQVNLTVDGRPFRAQTTATTVHEAVGLAIERLQELISPLDHRAASRGSGSPHRKLDRIWPEIRPATRKIVRRKPYPLLVQTPDEAADTLETLDYGFHLFIDAESGSDSVIYRGVPCGYLLAQVKPGPPVRKPTRIPLTVNAIPAPRLALHQARKELGTLEAPFLFFTDEGTGRGNVLYRRYDGDCGLILPASGTPEELHVGARRAR